MPVVDRMQPFLLRIRQEEAAVLAARSPEARLAHQGLVVRLRRTVELLARGRIDR